MRILAKRGGNLKKTAGVASFFISRIDSLVDSMINDKLKTSTDAQQQALLKSLLGKVAIANGKLTYQRYQRHFQRAAMASFGGPGGADPARSVGQHEHKESRLSRRDVR